MPLVTTTEMFKKAYEGGYAIGAFNVNNMEIIQGITRACKKHNAPVILQVSAGARKYASHNYLVAMVKAAAEETGLPIALHLDHGPDFETCKACIDGGFTSVMIDGSSLPYEENIALTKMVVEYAHAHGVVVEGELGTLAGIEDAVNVNAEDASFTKPEQVLDFVTRTGVDSLAIAIGTSHGAYKFKPGQKPQLRFDILEEVGKKLPGFPIVLHGASSVNQDHIKMINEYGGQLPADYDALRALPGIGEYTAGAIASISFGLPVPAVDGNVLRVFARLYNDPRLVTDPQVKREFTARGMENQPPAKAGDYNQALMELGALVCIPGTPHCEVCPLADLCRGYAAGRADQLPVKPAPKAKGKVPVTVALIESEQGLLLQRRPAR